MRILDGVCVALAVLSGAVLAALVGLTFADVVLRYVFAAPILGAADTLQMGMVLVVSLAFPFTWRSGGHIVVDLLPDYGLAALTRLRDLAVRFVGIAVFALLAWRGWVRSADAALFNEATNMIEIPFQPLFWALSGACAFQAAVLCVEAVRVAAGLPLEFSANRPGDDPAGG